MSRALKQGETHRVSQLNGSSAGPHAEGTGTLTQGGKSACWSQSLSGTTGAKPVQSGSMYPAGAGGEEGALSVSRGVGEGGGSWLRRTSLG